MKGASSRFASVAGIALLTALSTVCQLSAAANPLNEPRGLALASNGNLVRCQPVGNNIVVFNPNYAWMSSKTITADISAPVGVALTVQETFTSPTRETGRVTQYSSTGAENELVPYDVRKRMPRSSGTYCQ
jgi:hypothetical protein